jgi:hypothetical protein
MICWLSLSHHPPPLWLFCIARRIDIACQSGDLNLKGPFQASRCVAQSVCTAITFWLRSIRSGDAAVYTLADVQIRTEYTLVSWENHHDIWFEGSSTSVGSPYHVCVSLCPGTETHVAYTGYRTQGFVSFMCRTWTPCGRIVSPSLRGVHLLNTQNTDHTASPLQRSVFSFVLFNFSGVIFCTWSDNKVRELITVISATYLIAEYHRGRLQSTALGKLCIDAST